MKFLQTISLFGVFTVFAEAAGADALVLAERGKRALPIIIGRDASPVERYAAEELRDWTEKLTGARPEITTDAAVMPAAAIVLGETAFTEELTGVSPAAERARLGDDGFRLTVRGSRLVACGSRKRGALYAAYEILERFGGVMWLSSWHTVVPKRDRLAVPGDLDVSERPAFRSREPFWYDVLQHPEFAARLRVNALSWRKPDEKLGIGEFRFGGGLGSCHTFERLCSSKKLYDTHPEYFSEIKGKRLKERSQLCLTNPEVLDIVTSNVIAAIRNDPTARYFGVSQNDWYNACTCERCKAVDEAEGSQSGCVVHFVNAVAERVGKVHPDKIIETLAYQYSRKPPLKARLRDNVMPCLCTIECERLNPIVESRHKQTSDFKEHFRGWSALTDQLYVWDYAVDFRHYTMPFANLKALCGNIRFFRDNKVSDLFEQGSYQGGHGDFAELKAYLVAKLAWNPDQDENALIDRFLTGYFGKAAPQARAFLDLLAAREEAFEKAGGRPLSIFGDIAGSCLDDDFLTKASALWREAAAAVAGDDPVYAYNVKMAAFGTDYVRLFKNARTLWVTRDPGRFGDRRALARDLLARQREGHIRLVESQGQNDATIRRIRDVAETATPTSACDRATAHIRLFAANRHASMTDDRSAAQGRALRLSNTHNEWSATWPLSTLAYDKGGRYKARFHIRIENARTDRKGEVFWAGVYDSVAKRALVPDIGFRAGNVAGNGWFWCETTPFTPNDGAYLWIAPGRFDHAKSVVNPACTATFVDTFEIVRVD